MKRKQKNEVSLSKLFITDQALNNAEFDEFGHDDYASLIEKLIREQPTPFNIGIFGKWGVGKSSIVNLVKEKLRTDIEKSKIKFIEVRVWKYNENSLRRKFIVKIAEGLGLVDDLDIINKDIYSDREFETALLNYKDIVSTIFNKRSIALIGIIVSFALFVLFKLINIIGINNVFWNLFFQKLEDLFIIPLLISIVFWIIGIINRAKFKLKTGKYDSEEQFESKFIELVKRDKSKKIIFIDDLDRCSKEKVVKTIETIKTFLDIEKCIFIIACDDDIIKDAINRTYEMYSNHGKNEGAEYLEKFFQYTVRIPPFMIIDMRKYIFNVLKRNDSDLLKLDSTLEEIIFILINNNVKSPRNAITAINEFASAYLLANKRERNVASRLHQNNITNNLQTLAVVVSLKSHFPEFYNDVLRNSDLIFWIINILENNFDHLTRSQLVVCEKYFKRIENEQNERVDLITNSNNIASFKVDWEQPINDDIAKLFHFIESTKDYITTSDIIPFLYLGIDSTSYMIGDEYLQDFNDALKNGIESKIEKILGDADVLKKEYLFDHVNNWIQDKLEGVEKRKALQILSKQFYKCPESKLRETSQNFYRNFYKKQIKFDEYRKYAPQGVFLCARQLEPSKRKDLINQAFNFLKRIDIDYDKSILNEIFKNEDIINESELVKLIRAYIDKQDEEESSENVEPQIYLDLSFVKTKILELENKHEAIEKFFSGEIIDTIIDEVVKITDDEDSTEEDSKEIIKIFEILKRIVLDKDLKRLCDCYKKLMPTTNYYAEILIDVKIKVDLIPVEEIESLGLVLLKEIPNYGDENDIITTLDIIKFWLEKFDLIKESKLTDNLKDQLVYLAQKEEDAYFTLSINYFNSLNGYLKDGQVDELFDTYIVLINPIEQFDKSESIKDIILKNKDKISSDNRITLILKLKEDFNKASGINEHTEQFWNNIFDDLMELFEDGELDVLIMLNNSTNILSTAFPGVTNDDRTKFCNIITKGFHKISLIKQNEYFELFKTFLHPITIDNATYTISNVYPIRQYLKESTFAKTNINLFLEQFNEELPEVIVFKNVMIVFSCYDLITEEIIGQTLEMFPSCADEYPLDSIQFMFEYWEDFDNQVKFDSLKTLLPTGILKDHLDNVLDRLNKDIENKEETEIIEYIDGLEATLVDNVEERDLYAASIKIFSSSIEEDIKETIKANKISEIRSSSEIDLCRNKFSLIIGFKGKGYDKDREVNDLFFSLFNDTIEKKKLAIDVFEYYYEDRHPYLRKVELSGQFINLMNDFDRDYKETLKRLANKYELKIRRSFLEKLFGD